VANCTIAASPSQSAPATVAMTCSNSAPANISLDAGQGGGTTGAGADGATGSGPPRTVTVYSRSPAGRTPAAGAPADTITVTVTY
jgi:spore coat protein U-like protein